MSSFFVRRASNPRPRMKRPNLYAGLQSNVLRPISGVFYFALAVLINQQLFEAAIAQWIRQHLPFCGPRFEYQAPSTLL